MKNFEYLKSNYFIILTLLVVLFSSCNSYYKMTNLYYDGEKLSKTDKSIHLKYKKYNNDTIQVLLVYDSINLNIKVKKIFFDDSDSIQISLNSKVKDHNKIQITEMHYTWIMGFFEDYYNIQEKPFHKILFFDKNKSRDVIRDEIIQRKYFHGL